ncbi:MAG: RelA/SpoT family protein [Candidatus Dojkabacteria bacterium]|nr:RelA/SpoT family protein [Candidatus Dojkabacteria bacterium]
MKVNTDIQTLKQELLNVCTEKGYDINLIIKVFNEAYKLHEGQLRKSGDPYIVHPMRVSIDIAKLGISEEAVAASLLHDTIEDCNVDKKYIAEKFGWEIATLVDGVTKVDAIADRSLERYSEFDNLRKLIIRSVQDIRILLIKLADRLDNMRTIDALKPEKQQRYAIETLNVYVQLCEYIGIHSWKRELEDIAFFKKDPLLYHNIKRVVQEEIKINPSTLAKIIQKVDELIKINNISFPYRIFGRIKSVYSIYNKIHKYIREGKIKEFDLDKINRIKDLIAISVVINGEPKDCYTILGIVHQNLDYLPGEFDDYIAKPKPNGYKSLQTTIQYGHHFVEIQIKTEDMHHYNEFGPASHIAYKLANRKHVHANTEYKWTEDLNKWSQGIDYSINLFDDRIFVITPKGKIIELEKGSTPIDFAYAIHTAVGNNFIGAKVNNSHVKMNYVLNNADIVEIITSKTNKKPSLSWLEIARMKSTKDKIRSEYRKFVQKEELINIGKIKLDFVLNEHFTLSWKKITTQNKEKIIQKLNLDSEETLFVRIAQGLIKNRTLESIIKETISQDNHNIFKSSKQDNRSTNITGKTNKTIIIDGLENSEYQFAKCCKPIFGDDIIAVVTRFSGIKIHRSVCPNIANLENNRKLNCRWIK